MNLGFPCMIECSSEVNKYKGLENKKEGKLILCALGQVSHASDMKLVKSVRPLQERFLSLILP